MAREYARVQEFYLQLHDLQPPPQYHSFDLQSITSVPTGYEVTAGVEAEAVAGAGAGAVGGGAAGEGESGLLQHAPVSLPQEARKRKGPHFTEGYEMSNCELPHTMTSASASNLQAPTSTRRKRKPSSYSSGTATTYDDDGTEDMRSARTLPDKRQNHSEIEKRRRDKMNRYISELSAIVPMCGAISRKLDKLTVLRMTVQHMRSVRGALSAGPLTARPRPACLSERELNALVLRAAADCFLMVVGCDRGRLLYLSASVTDMLHYNQTELLGQSLFDILHPKDVSKVKEQLSSSDLSPRERLIDAKTMLPLKTEVGCAATRLAAGARRSFSCRIKCRSQQVRVAVKQEDRKHAKKAGDKKYCVVQCTGYLKSWAPAELSEVNGSGGVGDCSAEEESSNVSCLVAIGRVVPCPPPPPPPPSLAPSTSAAAAAADTPPVRQLQFISRHTPDGKFLFVDQRVTVALGFLPQELLGSSVYEYVSAGAGELGAVARAHKTALLQRSPARSTPYCFRRKDNLYALLVTEFKPFRNPWTKDVESLVANNTVVSTEAQVAGGAQLDAQTYKTSAQNSDVPMLAEPDADIEMQRLIDSQLECHKVGSTIAEEALRRSSTDFSPDLPTDLLQDALFNHQSSLVDTILCGDTGYTQVRNNVPLSAGAQPSPPPPSPPSPPPSPALPIDGNGEAAMAVIMSLLEAEAGLGGPVNFSGLPWPLP